MYYIVILELRTIQMSIQEYARHKAAQVLWAPKKLLLYKIHKWIKTPPSSPLHQSPEPVLLDNGQYVK